MRILILTIWTILLAPITHTSFMPPNVMAATKENDQQAARRSEEIIVTATVWMHPPEQTRIPAGDDEEHVVGVGSSFGRAEFSDGRKAIYRNVHFLDLHPGKYADVWGYTKISFSQESWMYIKWESKIAGLDKNGKPLFSGLGSILKGSGDYKGIKGNVKYNNYLISPTEEFPKGARESHATFTYTLPQKTKGNR